MPDSSANLADRSGGLIESQKGYQPRVVFFYFVGALLLCVLVGGLAYRQLILHGHYETREEKQNQRRIVMPGPRGDILDREGRVLAGSRAQVAVVVLLDSLQTEFRREAEIVHRNYTGAIADGLDAKLPTRTKIYQIARAAVMQRYLDQVQEITGRSFRLDEALLEKHFQDQRLRLLPFVLIPNLPPEAYAQLVEQLPINSPLEIYPTNARVYPYGAAAGHTIGWVGIETDIKFDGLESDNQLELTTSKMPGLIGRYGLEARFEPLLQGQAGGKIIRVNPSGYVSEELKQRPAVQGRTLITSLDIDLQKAAEAKLLENAVPGSAVAMDVRTGEVLVLASLPHFDLNEVSPRLLSTTDAAIKEVGGFLPRAIQGLYPPGSTFKILVTIAGMRAGAIDPDSQVECRGFYMVGNQRKDCHDSTAHGWVNLATAIQKSCNVFFYAYGILTDMNGENMAAEARRFGLDDPTGIELSPYETSRMIIPDRAWKRRVNRGPWVLGDTANMAIGQGDVLVTPLGMAAFMASVARNETRTVPTLIHDPNRQPQRTEPIGLSPRDYAALVADMELVTQRGGTGQRFTNPQFAIPGLRIAGKTGTAQVQTPKGTLNIAWFIGFAPADNPQIAFAIAAEGDTLGEEFGGGTYAVPVASAILKTWNEKRLRNAGGGAATR